MTKIKIMDLPYKQKVGQEELREIAGGTYLVLSVPSFLGFKSSQYIKYHLATEGSGYRSDAAGLEATQYDAPKMTWTNGDESNDS